jgi:hypothetical protein
VIIPSPSPASGDAIAAATVRTAVNGYGKIKIPISATMITMY